VQAAAGTEFLAARKSAYVKQVNAWRERYRAFVEAAKLDGMRMALLTDAGVANVQASVRARPCNCAARLVLMLRARP
jgi:hypothetical protein